MELADSTTARRRKPWVNGTCLAKPKYSPTMQAATKMAPTAKVERPLRCRRGTRRRPFSATRAPVDRGLLGGGRLRAGRVRRHGLPGDVGLVARLALVGLARGGRVRVRVGVVVVVDGGAVGRRARRAALVVRSQRGDDDDEPLPGAARAALGEQARDVAEEQRR